MDDPVIEALARYRTVDLITHGRRTGRPRTVEIWWFRFENRFIVTGTPGRRDWLANVRANPQVVVEATGHRLEGKAVEVTDREFRRRFFRQPEIGWYSSQAGYDRLVEQAPMIELVF